MNKKTFLKMIKKGGWEADKLKNKVFTPKNWNFCAASFSNVII
jgi:hypothetical protein